ncbi:ABC transporter permease [Amycolatopsis sp. DG1A-15b]|uniref:ABC transporter permease n=1 Tax=Amycolatopsis sp. DG1A-15b TaxID=3052846 RepID=UPI00255B86E3|nr:ABC transporter permease [Amycolatopsis sp. DG1A-15b]WIX92149.1 ABC transporter permease [Amycolatopsis sp. DG1A-15b]
MLDRGRLAWEGGTADLTAQARPGLRVAVRDRGRAPAYFALLAQTIAVGGSVLFGVIVVRTFGREFGQGTVKDLLALPTPRTTIVGAKFAVTAGWCLLLTLRTSVLGLVVGAALGLPGWSAGVAATGLVNLLLTAVMTFAVVTPFALAAGAGRGYLACSATPSWPPSAPPGCSARPRGGSTPTKTADHPGIPRYPPVQFSCPPVHPGGSVFSTRRALARMDAWVARRTPWRLCATRPTRGGSCARSSGTRRTSWSSPGR